MLNTETIKGIGFSKDKNRWYSKSGDVVIGYFFTKEEAIACKYGYLKALGIISIVNDNLNNLEHSQICEC
jgi:hypothetical protein